MGIITIEDVIEEVRGDGGGGRLGRGAGGARAAIGWRSRGDYVDGFTEVMFSPRQAMPVIARDKPANPKP